PLARSGAEGKPVPDARRDRQVPRRQGQVPRLPAGARDRAVPAQGAAGPGHPERWELGDRANSRSRNRRRIRRAERRTGQGGRRHGVRGLVRNRGFTYIAVLLATAILTAGVGLAIEAWHTTLRRDREADLLHIGTQYQRAIMLYYEGSPTGRPRYPRELTDLVRDERYPTTRRYLRKIYPDPVSGTEWGIMKAPDGGI